MNHEIIFNKIYRAIEEANNILLLAHEKPDMDAAASLCAGIELLIGLKKRFFAYCPTRPAAKLLFLPNAEKISHDYRKMNFSARDLIIAFDCGDVRRTGLAKEIMHRQVGQTVVNIDHHPKIDDFADLEVKQPEAASTTEIVYDFFKVNQITINKEIAGCILAGITGDTGHFIFQSTTDKAVKIAAEMISRGARLPVINEHAIRNKSLATLQTWGRAMSDLTVNERYGLAFTVLAREAIKSSAISDEELEGMANFLGNLKGVKAVLFLYEQENGAIKGSFRSTHPTIDVSLLARKLGGGGHAKAAGFSLPGRLIKENGHWRVET
jgi:phosphoesterase RecJ-like protein